MSKINASDVVKSYLAVTEQDAYVAGQIVTARTLRIDAARLTYAAVKSGTTTTAIGNAVAEQLKLTPAMADDVAYTSNTGVGYFSTVGQLLTLPGDLPDEAVIKSIYSAVKLIGNNSAKALMRRHKEVAPTYTAIMEAAAKIKADKADKAATDKLAAKTDVDLLTAAASILSGLAKLDASPAGKAVAEDLIKALQLRYSAVEASAAA